MPEIKKFTGVIREYPDEEGQVPNRQERRMMVPEVQVSKATVNMSLGPNSLLRGPVRTAAFTAIGTNDLDLWRNIVGESLSRMGYTRPDLVVGFITDMVNALPLEFRRALASFILQGLGLEIVSEEVLTCEACGAEKIVIEGDDSEFEHNDVPQVKDPKKTKKCPDAKKEPLREVRLNAIMVKRYEPLVAQEQPQERPKSELWTPPLPA